MRHIREWFSEDFAARDADPYWDEPTPWYRKQLVSHWGERVRLEIGDISADAEREGGEVLGPRFGIDLQFWENNGQFDEYPGPKDPDCNVKHRRHDHSFLVIFWRWGLYLAWRGGRVR